MDSRSRAKRFIFAFLYGAGDAKLASVLSCTKAEAKAIRNNFQRNMKSIVKLKQDLNRYVSMYGMIPLPDGRWVHIRSAHAALNTLLQGSGAIVLKATSVIYPELLAAKGLTHGIEYRQVLYVHDELQIETREDLTEVVSKAVSEAIVEAGRRLKIRCPLAVDTHVGKNWAESH